MNGTDFIKIYFIQIYLLKLVYFIIFKYICLLLLYRAIIDFYIELVSSDTFKFAYE